MAGPGSTGNVIAALCSLLFPGLGQLIRGRLGAAIFWFLLWCVFWVVFGVLTFGLLSFVILIVNFLACMEAAVYKGS